MNIFYLHSDPTIAAKAMTNKHVVKMIIESAQLLSTAHHILDGDDANFKDLLYKPTHKNHPSAIWVRESIQNYHWLYMHFLALCVEYSFRYDNKLHATYNKLGDILVHLPKNLNKFGFTQPPCAMPDQYKVENDSVASYRNYYQGEKLKTEEDKSRFKKILMI